MTKSTWMLRLLFPALVGIGMTLGLIGGSLLTTIPECRLHLWTGLDCPGCGGTRAFQALSRGNLLEAIDLNVFGVILIACVAYLLARVSWEAWFPEKRWRRFHLSGRGAWTLIGLILVFTVLRNLPWEPFCWLAP